MPSIAIPLDRPSTSTSRGWYLKTARHWLVACQDWSLSGNRVKMAELGGGQDVPFEQAFSNLAHAYVKDKAPKLLDYEVGFQLLEKNQENTKAVGVFGFKVGSQWLYAPVFFLNGDLKGHELLYIKSQDAFVPMKEAWINYLLGRKPSILGEGVDRNVSRLGVLQPNLHQLSRSPAKYAAHAPRMQEWALDFLPVLAKISQMPISTDLHLEGYLKSAGVPAVKMLLEACKAFPKFAQAIDRFYGEDFLERMVKEAKPYVYMFHNGSDEGAGKPKKPAKRDPRVSSMQSSTKKIKMDEIFDGGPPKCASVKGVRVITTDQVMAQGLDVIHDLSKDEKERLIKERVVVKDTRDNGEVTIAFNVQTKLELQNPDETNVYQVLVKPDTFKKCLVIMGPYGEHSREQFCTVVQLEGEKKWVNTHPANVWVTSRYDVTAFRKWVEEQTDAKSLDTGEGLTVLINGMGQGTCPFRVREKDEGGEDESKLYRVSFRDYSSKGRPTWLPDQGVRPHSRFDESWGDYDGAPTIRLTGKPGAKIKKTTGELWVPAGFKKISLKKPPEPKKDGDDDLCCSYDEDWGPLDLGNLLAVQLLIHSTTSPMKILADGKDVKVDDKPYDKVSAVVHLVKVVGLREKQARQCIAEAETHWLRTRNAMEFRLVKQAGPGDPMGNLIQGAPSAPPFPDPNIGADDVMGSNVPTMTRSEHQVGIPDMSASKTDRSIYDPRTPDPKSMAVAQQAAQTGQKEVFDTSAMGALLKSVRPDNMIDRYLGDMMKGMDRTGRVLFNYYWHGEEFEDRYGKQDMPELEDGLRNSFEGQGDIVLKLKQKTVDPDMTEGSSIDLSQVANS